MTGRRIINELYSIMPIQNIPSVIEHGILSHERAATLPHSDISMEVIQRKRDKKVIPGGKTLHEYANLYFCARNPMMYARKEQVATTCVLRIDVNIAWLDGVFSCDGNAASDYTRFYTREEWHGKLKFDIIFMDDWTSQDPHIAMTQKRQKCAEILIPDRVEQKYITGAYVGNDTARQNLLRTGFTLDIQENKHIFFL